MKQITVLALILLALASNSFTQTGAPVSSAATAPAVSLPEAIATLRHIDPSKLKDEEKAAKAQKVEQAWQSILAGKSQSTELLKAELAAMTQAKDKDDFFKLSAATLLWQLEGLKQAGTIADIWDTTPVSVQYNYTFMTAFQAAATEDAKAYPMIWACLKDDKGTFFVVQHAMQLQWPLTHAFFTGLLGPRALPALHRLMKDSKQPVQVKSALLALSKAQYLPALEDVRKLAKTGQGEVRGMALGALGVYGHPKDYDLLVSSLKDKDPQVIWGALYGLNEYGDTRAAPLVAPLLKSTDTPQGGQSYTKIKDEAWSCLEQLISPTSIDTFMELSKTASGEDKEIAQRDVKIWFNALGLKPEEWSSKSLKEKSALVQTLLKKGQGKPPLPEGQTQLSHKELREVLEEFAANHRLESKKFPKVGLREILAAATPEDLDLILEVRAKVLTRLSDECLGEVEPLEKIAGYVGRSRYRTIPGLCEKVESPAVGLAK
jgi:hypothetical protein